MLKGAQLTCPTREQGEFVSGRWTCLGNLTAAEVRHMFNNGLSYYGRGCLAEPFRILSGLNDEHDLTTLATVPQEHPMFRTMLALTLRHLRRCVPLILEQPHSTTLADTWFPQFVGVFNFTDKRENVGLAPRCPVSAEVRRVLQELAANEQLLYDIVRQRVDRMLATLKSVSAGGT